jgi:MtfA peptidase
MGTLKRWWQSRILASARTRFNAEDLDLAWKGLPILRGLNEAQAARLMDLALRFLHEKRIEAAQGVQLTNRMQLTIALQACLPILELGLDWYNGWYAVIVYPDAFIPERLVTGEDGIVWTEREAKRGEAWEQGPVILSWADVEAGLELDGNNVVLHEMAHKLDMRDGAANGCPPLQGRMSAYAWKTALTNAYGDLCRRVDADEDTPVDPYGSESPAEFFAVVSEAFFEIPAQLHREYPEVYEQFARFYRQTPLERLRSAPSSDND